MPDVATREEWATAFGEAVQSLRRKAGISQEAFADRCDVHRTFMSLLERGQRLPALPAIERIASASGMTASQLIRRVERILEG